MTDFELLLNRRARLRDDAKVSLSGYLNFQLGTQAQVNRYFVLMRCIDRLTAKERAEFHDLMELVAL